MSEERPYKKIRIALVLEATFGGTRKHLMYLATNLDKDKFDITVICSTLRDSSFYSDIEKLIREGINVKVIQMRREINPVRDLQALVKIYRFLRREKFDIVHTHSSKAGFLGRLAAKLSGVPVILYTPHAFSFHRGILGTNRFYLFLERFAAIFTDKIIAVSEGEKKIAIENRVAAPEKIVTIENGIRLSEFDGRETDAGSLKAALGIGEDSSVVGMVARLSTQKGYQYFLKASKEVSRQFPNVKFVLVGHGEQWRRAHDIINELGIDKHVIMTGQMVNTIRIYPIFDVFVLSSLWEGLPYVVLEAMAMGKPVIASRIPGIEDAVIDRETGYLVDPGDVSGLSAAIVDLLTDRGTAAGMGMKGRMEIENRFTLKDKMRKIENLYVSMAFNGPIRS